ncbi:hypothetical protein K3495_g10995 [Podosphaera aphanis]|nr:hypothetical protein K3495_g10995 [Podosphaera aphanis]
MVELQCENKVWYFRADNGKSEFSLTFTEFLKERGIQFEPCPPYKHSMNGVAERAIGILATYARSMLFEAQLPHQFWDYAIEHAVWIRNRVPTSALPFGPDSSVSSRWKIPHSVWYEKLPKLDNLRPFGCVATITYPSALLPQKWAPRSREGTSIFKHYKVGNRPTQKWMNISMRRRTPDYVPKPVVGRPKSVKQRRLNSRPLNSMPTEEATRGSVDAPHETLTRLRNPPQSAEHLAAQDARSAPGKLELSLIPSEDAPSAHRELAPLRELALSDEVTTSSSSVERSSTAVELPEASDQRVQDVHAGALVHLDVQKPAFGQTCSGRAVFINSEKSTPLGDPTPIYESITIDQAMEEDQAGWIEAITKELKALETTGTFTLLKGNPPKSRNLISSRLVLRHKIGANSTGTIKKARVVTRGFEQQAGIDYFETFASDVRYNTLRIILAISAVEDLEVDSIDINTAFLNPPLKEETYLEIPPFFELLDPSAN